MPAITRRLALALLLLGPVACASGSRRTPRAPEPATYVEVRNQSWLDQTVYVLRSTERIRLGSVGANSTQRFRMPRNLVFGATALRFMADPLGSSQVASSFEITVSPGETVTLTIPPR